MATKHQVIAAHEQNPDWTSRQIAEFILGQEAKDHQRLTSVDGWVRRTAQRNNLSLFTHPKPPPAPDGILALGRACRKAGLTLADITEIAAIIES